MINLENGIVKAFIQDNIRKELVKETVKYYRDTLSNTSLFSKEERVVDELSSLIKREANNTMMHNEFSIRALHDIMNNIDWYKVSKTIIKELKI